MDDAHHLGSATGSRVRVYLCAQYLAHGVCNCKSDGVPVCVCVSCSAGRDFNEAVGLIEEYLRASVPPNLLANRPPNNPMEAFDMSKEASYFLDPSCRRVEVGLGWQSKCGAYIQTLI